MYARRQPRKSYDLPDARNVACSFCVDVARETDRQLAAARVGHLARDGADPDQLVQPSLVAVELGAHVVGGADAIARGADRFVRFLRVLRPSSCTSRGCGGQVLLAVLLADRGARDAVIACSDRLVLSVRM